MVFRGRPSKACERCRVRRLKCDLRVASCGQCIRAFVTCAGYRDTEQLRIRDESQSVAIKVSRKSSQSQPQFLPLSVDLQARDAFFAFWVTSKCWNFLIPYAHPTDCPEALTLAIEAVSLAYLWHQVGSNAALVNAREKYVLALRRTTKVLRIPNEAAKETSLLACLLLDLFEKITELAPRRNRAWSSHVNGALALVQLRGLESFQNPSDFSILARLTSNSLMSCVCSGSPVPVGLMEIQEYIGKHLDAQDPKNQLSEIMIQYASLKYEAQRNGSSNEEYIRGATELKHQTVNTGSGTTKTMAIVKHISQPLFREDIRLPL